MRRTAIPKPNPDTAPSSSAAGARPADHRGDGPVRRCAVTREALAQTQMVRFVRAPDGWIVPDIAARLPGRGVWVTARRDILERAMAGRAFERGLKARAQVDEDLCERVEQLLVQRCIDLLGFARKAGQAVMGHDQVRASLQKKRPAWLIEARDGSVQGREKLTKLAGHLHGRIDVADCLVSDELGMAFGRPRVIHALIQVGRLAESWSAAYRRLEGFRPVAGGQVALE